jgi:hypothetical protein
MTPDVVGGDGEEGAAQPVKLAEVLLVQGELFLRDRLPVGGIEQQNGAAPVDVSQGNRGVGPPWQSERRGLCAGWKRGELSVHRTTVA